MALRVPSWLYRLIWIGAAVFAALTLVGSVMILAAMISPSFGEQINMRVVQTDALSTGLAGLAGLVVLVVAVRRLLYPLKSPNPAAFD